MPSLPRLPRASQQKKSPPNFSLVAALGQFGHKRIVGIDEVGRGALAGPLVVAAVELNQKIDGITDSKLLLPLQRRFLAEKIHQQASQIRFGSVSAQEIDALGLAAAQRLAYNRALENIHADLILTDHYRLPGRRHLKAVQGDRLFYPVAAASIVAKVFRDQLMAVYAGFYPAYGWHRNVGYGTAAHRREIMKKGSVATLHRESFVGREKARER